MPTGYLEHANITVSDPDRLSGLLQNLCGWHERWRGPSAQSGWSLHVGNDDCYLALYTRGDGTPLPRHDKSLPLNHIGIVVKDLVAADTIVREAGLEPYGHETYEPGSRFYFFDWDGIEFEIVSYG